MPDIVNAYFKRFYPPAKLLDAADRDHTTMLGGMTGIKVAGFSNTFPQMECIDGFSVSVQGHRGAYSSPRDDFADHYSSVELGFPSAHEPLLNDWQEGDDDPTETVYGYVPISVVVAVIEKHGGLVEP